MLNSFGNITDFHNSQSWIPILLPVLPKLLGLQEVGRTWQLPTGFDVMGLTDSSAGTAETREPASEGRSTGVAPVSASVEEHRTSFCWTVEPTSWSWSLASAPVVLELCSISVRCTPTSTAALCGGGVGPRGPLEAWLRSRRWSQAGLVGLCVDVQRLLLQLHVVPVVKDRIPERKQWEGRSINFISFCKSIKAIGRIPAVSGAQMKGITIWSSNFYMNWTFHLFTFIYWSEKQLVYFIFFTLFYQQLALACCKAGPALSSTVF